jgi:uncharacterized membrane protein YtjA (UPF0391 family)
MLRWALTFFIVALIAAVFGFFGIAAAAAGVARILFLHLPGVVPGFTGQRAS